MVDESSRTTKPHDYRSLPQALRVLLVAVALVGLYWVASGGGSGNEIDSHRLIVAQCWDSLERKTAAGRNLQDETRNCMRMERGFAQMYGTGA